MPLSSEDRALAHALRCALAAEASALAGLYAERAPAAGRDASAIAADAALLGAGNALAYLRQLGAARPPRRDGDRMGKRAFAVRFPLADRVARPGVRAWILAEDAVVDAPPAADGTTLVYVRAAPPSVALNAALHALFVAGGKVTLVVDPAEAGILGRALAAADARLTVDAGDAARAAELAREATRITAIAPEAERRAIHADRDVVVAGYATDAPATYVVFPYYYDKRELRHLARHAAADFAASPTGSTNVEIVVCRTWEQRDLFEETLRAVLVPKGAEAPAIPQRRAGRSATDAMETRPPGVSTTVLDTDAPEEFGARASAYLTRDDAQTHAISAVVHPLELEKPARVRDVDDLLARTSARVVAINARPTLAYVLGAVPFGPRGQGVQNAQRVGADDRVVVEAPYHLSPCEARGWAMARGRFERAPSFPRALGLALRAIF